MSPEAAALPELATHAASTRALADLLAWAAEALDANVRFAAARRIGPLPCRVLSNDAAAGARLSRCLLPDGDAAVPAAGPGLTLRVLCGNAAPHELPPPWNFAHSDPRHRERLHLSPDGRISAFYDHDRRFWMAADRDAGAGLLWIADAADIPFWEEAAPFKLILHWLLAPTPLALVHGGVVSHDGRGLLLVGAGGAGKSTTVAACLQAGLGVCGDDLVLVEAGAAGWSAHALYDSVKLAPDGAVPPPPLLAAAPWQPCGDKRLVRYSDVAGARLVTGARLVGVAQCTIAAGAATGLEPQAASALLRALGPPTVFLLRGREAATLQKIAALVRGLPTLRLVLGPDPADAACTIRRWLEAAA